MNAYRFDADTKEFFYILDCDESQLEPGVWLVPAYSTLTEPPEEQDGYARVWDADAWVQTEDHRIVRDNSGAIVSGTPYWLDVDSWNTAARYMTELGPLPDGALTTADTDLNAIFTLQAGPDFIAPEALFAAHIDLKNQSFKDLVLLNSRWRQGKKRL